VTPSANCSESTRYTKIRRCPDFPLNLSTSSDSIATTITLNLEPFHPLTFFWLVLWHHENNPLVGDSRAVREHRHLSQRAIQENALMSLSTLLWHVLAWIGLICVLVVAGRYLIDWPRRS